MASSPLLKNTNALAPEEQAALFRLRELELKEREIELKQKELERRWTNPLVISLFAAALGLAGNIAVALINAHETQTLERYRMRANLIIESTRTGNQEVALRNLKFFVDNELVEDPDGKLRRALNQSNAVPVLPVDGLASLATAIQLAGMVVDQTIGQGSRTSDKDHSSLGRRKTKSTHKKNLAVDARP